MDPAAKQFEQKHYSTAVPMGEGTTRLVFALEIIEHLTSPFIYCRKPIVFCSQLSGSMTPNVTRIGNVMKLLAGRTLNDRLAPPGYDNPNDEWRPHAREYAMHELADMLRSSGFEISESRHFLGEDTQDCRQTAQQQAIDWGQVALLCSPASAGESSDRGTEAMN